MQNLGISTYIKDRKVEGRLRKRRRSKGRRERGAAREGNGEEERQTIPWFSSTRTYICELLQPGNCEDSILSYLPQQNLSSVFPLPSPLPREFLGTGVRTSSRLHAQAEHFDSHPCPSGRKSGKLLLRRRCCFLSSFLPLRAN